MTPSSILPTRENVPARLAWPFPRSAEWPELGLLGSLLHPETAGIRVEEIVDGDNLVIRAELPGINPDKDVEVSISNSMLHIDAKREDKIEHKDHDGFHTEFRYGSFSRSIALPPDAYEHEVHATYENGILEVRLPIAVTSTRKIPVKHS